MQTIYFQKQNKGLLNLHNNDVYDGMFVNDKFNGIGKLFLNTQKIKVKGIFQDYRPQSPCKMLFLNEGNKYYGDV